MQLQLYQYVVFLNCRSTKEELPPTRWSYCNLINYAWLSRGNHLPETRLPLSDVNKFMSYVLMDSSNSTWVFTMDHAVGARFDGTELAEESAQTQQQGRNTKRRGKGYDEPPKKCIPITSRIQIKFRDF